MPNERGLWAHGTFSFALVFSFLICSAYRYIKMICFGVRGTIGYDYSVYKFYIIIFHFIWSYFWYYYTLSKCSLCSQNKLLLWAAEHLERVGSVAPINESDFEFKKADWSIICCGPIHSLQIMLQIHLHKPAIALSRICTHALSRSALVNAGSLKTNTGTQKSKIWHFPEQDPTGSGSN